MNILYYELVHGHLPAKYVYIQSPPNDKGPLCLLYVARRIWRWDSNADTVEFIKNRNARITEPVDPKEFLLIQLQAKEYQYETA